MVDIPYISGMNRSRWEPSAKRPTLIKTAGILWVVVGLYLFGRGMQKILPFDLIGILLMTGGIGIGILKYYLLFRKILKKNISRIYQLAPEKDKICIFAFQAMQSYLLVAVMMLLGGLLRTLPIEPRILGTIFLAIGTALYIGGYVYLSKNRTLLNSD